MKSLGSVMSLGCSGASTDPWRLARASKFEDACVLGILKGAVALVGEPIIVGSGVLNSQSEIPALSKPVPKLAPSEEKAAPEPEKILLPGETKAGKEGRLEEIEEKSSVAEEKPILLPEGKSILLYGGAAAVAILAVAVGVALALRKK